MTNVFGPNGTSHVISYDATGQTREIRELSPDAAGRYTNEFVAPLPQPYTEPSLIMTYDALSLPYQVDEAEKTATDRTITSIRRRR